MKREDLVARCVCGCNVVCFYAQDYWDEGDTDISICVYLDGGGMSLAWRLKEAWTFIRGRQLLLHNTVLSLRDQTRLARWLMGEPET